MIYTTQLVLTRHGATRARRLWVTILVSLLLHAVLLWQLPMRLKSPTPDLIGEPAPLVVQLAPSPAIAQPPVPARPQTPAPPPPLAQTRVPQPPAIAPTQRPPPPPIAMTAPAPVIPAPIPPPPVREAVPVPAPSAADLTAYIAQRRVASGEPAPAPAAPVEDENARASRIAAANLRLKQPAMGYDPSKSGGIFEVKRKNIDYAEFTFFGWQREVRRDIAQQYEVRKGNHETIELAIVRKMIEIIRQYEQEEFTWNSRRLGRSLKLSARVRDTASLEQFLLREFF